MAPKTGENYEDLAEKLHAHGHLMIVWNLEELLLKKEKPILLDGIIQKTDIIYQNYKNRKKDKL